MTNSKSQNKRRPFSIATVAGLTFVVLTQFTNCDTYSEGNLFSAASTACASPNSCQESAVDFLAIRINSDQDIGIHSGLKQFNVGGDCNSAGFSETVIRWEVNTDNSVNPVATSESTGLFGFCDKGRFSLLIDLPRKGLRDPNGNRIQHRLEIQIIGIDSDGNEFFNDVLGRSEVFLVPI